VVLEIARAPDSPVVEYEHGQRAAQALWADHLEPDRPALDAELALVDLDAGQVDGRLACCSVTIVRGLVAGQVPERAAVLVPLLQERAGAAIDCGVVGRIELRAVDWGCHVLLSSVGCGHRGSPLVDAAAGLDVREWFAADLRSPQGVPSVGP
jgi:hypothetical protein